MKYVLVDLTRYQDKCGFGEIANNVGEHLKCGIIDENVQYFLNEGVLPNGYKPIIMESVEDNLRSQGAIDTNELLKIINKHK